MIKHIESSLLINFSNEYALFRMINGNRQLNEKKINKIIAEIKEGNDMLKYYPIQVRENDGRLDILDGQHRFYISRLLKRPVFYILVNEHKSMVDIAKVNSNVEKWKPEDFINCYVQFDNKHYIQLRAFMEKYGLSLGICLKLLGDGVPGKDSGDTGMVDIFRNGYFEVQHFEKAEQLAKNCQMFMQFSGWRSRGFVIAIHKICIANLYPLTDLLANFKKNPDLLTQQANYKSYITILEMLANIGKQKRIIIA